MHDIRAISALFQMHADFIEARPFGSGHINDTYCALYHQAGSQIRYIHQRLNTAVFKDSAKVMENVARVTQHSHSKLLAQGCEDAHRRTLTFVPSLDGLFYAVDASGNVWRTCPFIENTKAYDVLESNEQAYQAARAFGLFQSLTADMGGERLHETIPRFHDTPHRLATLEQTILENPHRRASSVRAEIEFARARAQDCGVIVDLMVAGKIPERITHNDTKINNVLLDEKTAEGVCVIDLDTTMPGSALYDFGDMVRSATSSTTEDETNSSQMELRLDRFEALTRGYLSSATFLNVHEIKLLAFSGKLLTLECGIRFLTDYLQGDAYFKTDFPEHNLVRTRNQFSFVKILEKKLATMQDLVMRVVDASHLT